jgi:RecJ-like exonuclease
MQPHNDATGETTSNATNPGDEGPPDAPGVGEDLCSACHGTGKVEGTRCAVCGGTGKVLQGIGGG